MTILFLILLLLLALAAQMRVFQCSLKMLRSDYWPERKIVDPEDPFDVVVSVRNMSSHYVPFVKVEEFFREPIHVLQQDAHISGDAVRGGHRPHRGSSSPGPSGPPGAGDSRSAYAD